MDNRLSDQQTHRLVHLDLKGAPPKPSYLKSLYPLFVKWGVTGLLLEWEDCFPYEGEFEVLNSKLYSKDDALQLIQDAKEAKLEVIPLVQTFGHLEFLLKHSEFVKLREVPLFPSSLCPSHPDALSLVTSILEQVIKFHVGIKSIHIGADEVWHMGRCERCKLRLQEGETRDDLFLTHVRKVLLSIREKWPALNIIMWDDMLREIDEANIKSYGLKELVEPMVWHYNAAENFQLPPDIWQKYSLFDFIWIASAFKGATGGSQLLAPVGHHASNNFHWMCCIPQIKSQFRGIALTGWSRYDHFAALCELLPTSLPCLGVCLKVLEEKTYTPAVIASVEKDLGYPNIPVTPWSHSQKVPENLNFYGWEILLGVSKLINIRHSINGVLASEQLQTWMNDWQVAHGVVNPMHLVEIVPALNNILGDLNAIEKYLLKHMPAVFQHATIDEWLGTYVTPLRTKLITVLQTAESCIEKSSRFVDDVCRKNSNTVEMDC